MCATALRMASISACCLNTSTFPANSLPTPPLFEALMTPTRPVAASVAASSLSNASRQNLNDPFLPSHTTDATSLLLTKKVALRDRDAGTDSLIAMAVLSGYTRVCNTVDVCCKHVQTHSLLLTRGICRSQTGSFFVPFLLPPPGPSSFTKQWAAVPHKVHNASTRSRLDTGCTTLGR